MNIVSTDITKGKFTILKKTLFSELKSGAIDELPESDLCFQDATAIYQFKYTDGAEQDKVIIKPGVYTLVKTNQGVSVVKSELAVRNLLTSVVNTKAIVNEANAFFANLGVYDMLGEPKARKILLYSNPGMGKTTSMAMYCNEALKEDPGTVVLLWPTSGIDSDDVLSFLTKYSTYAPECTRMIFVVEDIGGGERDGPFNSRAVDSALLDILDGIQVAFQLPTLIIATTNYPQNLLSALADRPGRFDLMLQLAPPSADERVLLVEFIAKRVLTDAEKTAIMDKKLAEFSAAHLKEIVIRSMLHNKSLAQVAQELIDHKKKFQKDFDEDKGGGAGFGF